MLLQQARPRTAPFVWVTWISKLMAGEEHCQWSAWFRAHYSYDKSPAGASLANWALDHSRLVDLTNRRLEADGYTLWVEAQNRFNLTGGSGVTLSGCPDLVATRDGQTLVIDCKTGAPRESHIYQTLIYMLCLPHDRYHRHGGAIEGLVQYPDSAVDVSSLRLTPEFRAEFRRLMQVIGGAAIPSKRPSLFECRYCAVGEAYCPDRIESELEPAALTDLFD